MLSCLCHTLSARSNVLTGLPVLISALPLAVLHPAPGHPSILLESGPGHITSLLSVLLCPFTPVLPADKGCSLALLLLGLICSKQAAYLCLHLPGQALFIPPILAQRLSDGPGRATLLGTHLTLGTSVPHLASANVCDLLSMFIVHVTSMSPAHRGGSVMFIQQKAGRMLCFLGPYFLDHEMEALRPKAAGAFLP